MLTEELKRRIAEACVTIAYQDLRGQGVLVGGQLILTAAHNVLYLLDQQSERPLASALVGLSLGDYAIVPLETSHGLLYAAPYAIEPISDIAVLGALDNQECGEQVEAYEAWCEAVTPVSLCYEAFALRQPVSVAIYTHLGTWVEGT